MKLAALPATVVAFLGSGEIVKLKLCVGVAVKLTGTECEIVAASVPVATMLKLYACARLLETVTVKGVPALDGVALAGLGVQVEGAPTPQARATALL